ncbi:cytochrome P450 [Streptomyces sp. NPDC015346]|uniref:cytochrome P450 n=1 Tax=Streptomyces sp. NPDC015346 TaxID=3364954 RepID=UPI0036F74A0A
MHTEQEPLAYPFASGAKLELHPLYAELRDQPLVRVRMPYGEDAWLATRYSDVKTVLSDPRFSVAVTVRRDYPRVGPAAGYHGGLMSLDPPEHTRVRGVVAKEFTARRVEALRLRARRLAEESLDRMVESGPPVDLVENFAVPFPVQLNCELLGLPQEYARFWEWVETIQSGIQTDSDLGDGLAQFSSRIAGLVELRREQPGDGLIDVALRACDEDGRLTEQELHALVGDLLVAGFGPIAGQITVSLYHLLTRPRELSRLRERPELIPDAAKELLRYVQLVDFTVPRYAVEDVELGGVLIRAGEPVLAAVASANRDAAAFPDPDALVLNRVGVPHLAFGHGPHHCLGAHLARLELEVALETALQRLPGLRLAVAEDELRWKPSGIISGLHELPVTFDIRSGGRRHAASGRAASLGTPIGRQTGLGRYDTEQG